MHQAIIHARARQTESKSGKVLNTGEEDDAQINLASERAKYKSFWVGVNRGITLASKNPKVLDDENKKIASDDGVRSKGLFEPDGPLLALWTAYITLLILYSVVMIPVRLAFEPAATFPFEIIEDIVLVSFAVDILVNFNTAIKEPGSDHVVHNRRIIAIKYLKFWFWVDIISTIPFTIVAGWFHSTNVAALRAIRILRLLRIFKLFRITKFNETLQNFRFNQHVINLFVLLLAIFFVAHLFACGWHYMALQKEQTSGGQTWVSVLGYADKSVYDLYVASLYYVMVTMMTVGFGDIHPVTDNERIYAIATMLTGGVVFGAMISRLASILEKRNPEAKALRQNMTELKSYLVDVALPHETRKKVVDAYAYYLNKKSVFGEPTFFDDLPQPILYRLVKQMNEDDIRSVKLFHTYEMEFVVPLLLALKPFQVAAGETIFNEGDICDTIVFLKKGKIAISSSNGFNNVLAGYVRAGGYFGDMEYLRNTTCIATYAASKHSQLLSVNHTTFNQAGTKCLDAGVRFRKETEIRYSLFKQVIKQNKREQDHGFQQYSIEESRAIVNKMLHKAAPVVPLITPRRRASLTAGVLEKEVPPKPPAPKAPVAKPAVKKSLVPSTVTTLWIDGIIVDTRNLNLLARNSDKLLPNETDEVMVRVIYRNSSGKIGPGEVPEGYLYEKFLISPINNYKVGWDLMIAVMVVYSIVIIPMEIAFNSYAFGASPIVEQVLNGFFLADILVCFRTAYFEDEGDYLVVVPYLVARKYLCTWCLIDLAGSLPFDDIFASVNGSTNLTFTRLLKVIRLMRLLKLARLMKVGNISEQVEDRLGLSPTAMSLVTLLLQVFFVGHLMACILFGVSSVITAHPWYNEEDDLFPPQEHASMGSKYILSLYWTFTIMSTVGYGDILPNNTAQRLLCVFVILLGASMFGYMIANVSALIQSFNSTDSVKDERIETITMYLDEKQTPLKLQDAVVKHFRNYFKHASPFDVDAMLDRLPQNLANEILLVHNETTLKSIAILRYIENVSVRLYIFNLMKPVYYEPNEYMIQQGSPGQEIMFIVEGRALAFKRVEEVKKKVPKKKFVRPPLIRQLSISRRSNFGFESIFNMSAPSEADKGYSPVSSPQGFVAEAMSRKKSMRFTQSQLEMQMKSPESPVANRSRKHSMHFDFPEVLPTSSTKEKQRLMQLETSSASSPNDLILSSSLKERKKSSQSSASSESSTARDLPPLPTPTPVKERKKSIQFDNSASFSLSPPPTNGEKEEKKDNRDSFNLSLKDIYPTLTLDMAELDFHHAPELTPANNRLKFSVDFGSKKSRYEDSDSDNDDTEFDALRKAQNPQQNASKVRSRARTHLSEGDSGKTPHRGSVFNFGETETPSQKNSPAPENFEDDDDDPSEDESGKVDPSFAWSELNMRRKGLKAIGSLAPGNFVGHLAVMHDDINDSSVVTSAFSTVYILHKQDITPILTKQPTVSVQLQMAMSRAISTQSDILGKYHMRQNRSKFLNETKETFYKKLAVRPIEVKRIRKAQKNKMIRMAHGIKKKVRKPGDDRPELSRMSSLAGSVTGSKASLNTNHSSELDLSGGGTLTEKPSADSNPSFNIFGLPTAEAMSVKRILPKSVVRKVKRVERVLTKYAVLYDSDEEADETHHHVDAQSTKKHRIHAHRTPLPSKVTLRSASFVPVDAPVTLERAPPKRRSSLNLLTSAVRQGSNPDLLNTARTSSTSTVISPAPRMSSSTITPPQRTSFIGVGTRTSSSFIFDRLLARKTVDTKKTINRRNRVMSMTDLDTLEPTSDIYDLLSSRSPTAPRVPMNAMRSVIVPIYSHHIAVQRSTEALLRRQSFPALENDLWKIGITSQGLL